MRGKSIYTCSYYFYSMFERVYDEPGLSVATYASVYHAQLFLDWEHGPTPDAGEYQARLASMLVHFDNYELTPALFHSVWGGFMSASLLGVTVSWLQEFESGFIDASQKRGVDIAGTSLHVYLAKPSVIAGYDTSKGLLVPISSFPPIKKPLEYSGLVHKQLNSAKKGLLRRLHSKSPADLESGNLVRIYFLQLWLNLFLHLCMVLNLLVLEITQLAFI
ncbi:MAG: hypothetical protein ACI8Y7_000805 [Candidatus Woesearchaeota archaeon]|jgi:hypothetical protein